jgi:isoprenylcysteine carboxyl methyltransferase (ICMT) family protein YpbQ
MFDRTIRGSRDLLSVTGDHLLVEIHYISTTAELTRKKTRIVWIIGTALALLLLALLLVHFLVRPLDELWAVLMVRVFSSWPM